MKGKKTFSANEVKTIAKLIEAKLLASPAEQKKIRNQIRKLGFYASDFGLGGGYTTADFMRVVSMGTVSNSAIISVRGKQKKASTIKNLSGYKRTNSDEHYVVSLCESVLECTANRQHRFDFLCGDSGMKLPVDAFFVNKNLVVEYRERQHSEPVRFFDRKETVSGIPRGEQRKKYDELRRKLIPKNGMGYVEIDYSDFNHSSSKRIIRDRKNDMEVIRRKLKKFIF